MRWAALILLLILTAATASAATGKPGHVTGEASYRERLELPPGAVFEVVLEDVSVADAPAKELGRATLAEPGEPPFAFKIAYDPEAIEPDRTYSVRAQVSVGRRLIFVSDTMNPVLTQGAPDDVEVWMIKVGDTQAAEASDAPTAIGAHGLRLPASFTGDLPCPTCEWLRYQLNLWPDQVFHLRREWAGNDVTRDFIGRWSVDPDQRILTLRGAEETLQLKIEGPDRLRIAGEKGAGYVLTAGEEFHPFEPHLPLRGMITYVADEARFTECLTGRDYPLVREGDYEALEHAYLAAGAEAGGAIMASFDGGIVQAPEDEGSDVVPKVLVERFVGVWPGETCERSMGEAGLTNTYWKILRLGQTEVSAGEGRREPNLILREGGPSFTATVGCNAILGSYALDGDSLSFEKGAATLMACQAPLDAWEQQLTQVLGDVASWRVDGQTLELLDSGEDPLALLQAVYLY